MKHAFLGLTLSVMAVSSALAAPVPVPAGQKPGYDRIRETDLRADLGFLASDGMQGRMSLQPGDEAAIQWVAAEFAKAGLTPAATDARGAASFLQPVPLLEYRPNSAANSITLQTGTTTQIWKFPDFTGGYKNDLDLSAPLVFAGYGITAPGIGYDDYQGLDARGKIVVVIEHEPQENDPKSRFGGTGNTRHATNRVKAL
ncbi:MAG: peptidase M28, partial [Sandarakinorhabdus sp.]